MLAVSQPAMSRIESGLLTVSETMLDRLCDVLGFPAPFFFQTDAIYGVGVGELFHERRRQAVPSRLLTATYARMSIHRMALTRLFQSVELPECRIEPFDWDDTTVPPADVPREMARAVRARWLLPRGPIADVCQTIEDAGGVIVPVHFGTENIDTISTWYPGQPPLFFINPSVKKDRLRFTLCHELGHLILHQYGRSTLRAETEQEADLFAAELLMPEKEIKPYLHHTTLDTLARLKPYWKVSMQALAMRAYDLKQITSRQKQYLFTQLSKLGYRKTEPPSLDITSGEEAGTLPEMLNVFRQDLGYSLGELGKRVNWTENYVRSNYLPSSSVLHLVP